MLYDYLASLWRTVVPIIAGALLAMAARAGWHIDSSVAASWLTAAFGAVYYAAFRLAEAHLGKGWGWLLGLARPPKYPDASGAVHLAASTAPTVTIPAAPVVPTAPPSTGAGPGTPTGT